jgi:L-ascorbate metabolism protein UlaG (beta-lactamase superfamily)
MRLASQKCLPMLLCIMLLAAVGATLEAKDNAEIYQERLAKLKPDDAEGHYKLGQWCESNKLADEAKAQFEKVLELKPDHGGARGKLGYIKYKSRWIKPDEKNRVDYEEKLAKLNKDDAKSVTELGTWCSQKKMWAEAVEYLKRAAELSPDDKAVAKALDEAVKMLEKEPKPSVPSVKEGAAAVWYLYHSGFAVKTAKHFLVFDYSKDDADAGGKRNLAGGVIDPEEIKDENVIVFVSHGHGDHFSPVVTSWQDKIKKISYIVDASLLQGFQASSSGGAETVIGKAGTTYTTDDGVAATFIQSTDEGLGFLVEVDGVVIFHAGDTALWGKGAEALYQEQIGNCKGKKIDIAFLPLQPKHGNRQGILDGAIWAVKELLPKVVFPMHSFGMYGDGRTFVNSLGEQKDTSQAMCAEKRGQSFLYGEGRLTERK